MPLHQNGSWRTKKSGDWHITLLPQEKSETGFVGLKNLGCICYMNSLFQQIFMIPSFRNDILEIEDPHKEDRTLPPDENVLLQIQNIFGALHESEKQYFNPKGFCQAFKDWDGQPVNVMDQMDVDEFFNTFTDKLENLIKSTKQQNTINYHFGGKFANQLICKDCPHYRYIYIYIYLVNA